MDAASTFYKMKAIASLSSSSLIAPSGAVAAMVVSWTLRHILQAEGRRRSEQQFVDCSSGAVAAMVVSWTLRSHST